MKKSDEFISNDKLLECKKIHIASQLSQIQDKIKISYMLWLEKLNEINSNTRYSKKDIGFGASGAGLCHLKHYFRTVKAPKKETGYDSMCKMRVGTLIHEDIQNSLYYMFDDNYKVMCEIPVTYGKVKGHLDIAIEVDKENVMLIDIKTMAAFSWSKKYGRDKNPNAAMWNKLQLATYSLGLKQDYGYKNVHMFLLNYNKNTSAMKFEPINTGYYEKEAKQYWKDVETIVKSLIKEPKKLKQVVNVPVHSWECNYCDYSEHCPVKKEKK